MSQQVYVAYKNIRGRVCWIKGPMFYSSDEKTAIFFTPITCSVGFLTRSFPSGMEMKSLIFKAQDRLDDWHIGWSDMKEIRFACRKWKDTIEEVCLVDFSLLGPLPSKIGALCSGERVDKPRGEMVCYGG
jgi:hypothetical protein